MADEQDGHSNYCAVFTNSLSDQQHQPNETMPCTCGYRTRAAVAAHTRRARFRYVPPLGMSKEDFLRTLGIKPEEL